MNVGNIPGVTRILGEQQGYIGLPIRDVVEHDNATDRTVPAMQSLWYPSVEDMKKILSGAAIRLTLLGSSHPPVRIEIVDHAEIQKEIERVNG